MSDFPVEPLVEPAAEAPKPKKVKKAKPLPPKGSAAYKAMILRGEIKE